MVELSQRALREASNRDQDLPPHELLELLERHHPGDDPGLSRETLSAYAEALAEESGDFDADSFLDAIEERRSATGVWSERVYDTGENRVSAHPPDWHDSSGLDERVLDEIGDRRRTLLVEDALELIERHHPHEKPGVAWATLKAYAGRLDEDLNGEFDPEEFLTEIEANIEESDSWSGPDAFYPIEGSRVSSYPAGWHDRLGGSIDMESYVRFLNNEADFAGDDTPTGGAGQGVPESTLLDVVTVIGGVDQRTAKARLEERRDDGTLVEDADQHPDARVRLAEEIEADRHTDDRAV